MNSKNILRKNETVKKGGKKRKLYVMHKFFCQKNCSCHLDKLLGAKFYRVRIK